MSHGIIHVRSRIGVCTLIGLAFGCLPAVPEPEESFAGVGVREDAPPDPELPDPTACPFDGEYVNCRDLLSPNNLCDSVFPEPEVPGAPVVPNYPLLVACIACDADYQYVRLDECTPVETPPLDAGPQDVVIEDVVIEDVAIEDVVVDDVSR